MTQEDPNDRNAPSHEAIAARAYELYLARGGEHGLEDQDWLQAEAELREQDAASDDPAGSAALPVDSEGARTVEGAPNA